MTDYKQKIKELKETYEHIIEKKQEQIDSFYDYIQNTYVIRDYYKKNRVLTMEKEKDKNAIELVILHDIVNDLEKLLKCQT